MILWLQIKFYCQQRQGGISVHHDPSIQALPFIERVQRFQENLNNVASLDEFIALSHSVLNASLCMRDHNGVVLSHSPVSQPPCVDWSHESCDQQSSCALLSFPIQFSDAQRSGMLLFAFCAGEIAQDDRYLAAVIAGTLAQQLQLRHLRSNSQHSRIQLFRDLLQYKPGLQSYYERSIAMEHLSGSDISYQVAVLAPRHERPIDMHALTHSLQYRFPSAWVLDHREHILMLFHHGDAEPLRAALESFLDDSPFHGCLSVPFSNLLELRYVFENTCAACRIASRKKPGASLYRAEQYLSLSFLDKCRQYFPLEKYYTEGFERLVAFDRANGKDYLSTLRAYLENGMNVNAAAKAIFMHRNTMAQQLEKIEQILGCEIANDETCWYLQLCLRIYDLLSV